MLKVFGMLILSFCTLCGMVWDKER